MNHQVFRLMLGLVKSQGDMCPKFLVSDVFLLFVTSALTLPFSAVRRSEWVDEYQAGWVGFPGKDCW